MGDVVAAQKDEKAVAYWMETEEKICKNMNKKTVMLFVKQQMCLQLRIGQLKHFSVFFLSLISILY